jgi:hypothetical protein
LGGYQEEVEKETIKHQKKSNGQRRKVLSHANSEYFKNRTMPSIHSSLSLLHPPINDRKRDVRSTSIVADQSRRKGRDGGTVVNQQENGGCNDDD